MDMTYDISHIGTTKLIDRVDSAASLLRAYSHVSDHSRNTLDYEHSQLGYMPTRSGMVISKTFYVSVGEMNEPLRSDANATPCLV